MQIVTNILPDREPFIGRARECWQLQEALERGERLIAIIGPSGIGKTRLAKQIALRQGSSSGGESRELWSCDLVGEREAASIEEKLAACLHIPQGEGALIRDLERRGRVLLLLYNCERLGQEARERILSWLDRLPALQIIATSLIRLEIEGELLYELGPLEKKDAIELYEDRAGRAWADRTFAPSDRAAIESLVERLDRFPLAIELAASRVRVLPPQAMLTRIGDRFELLQSRRLGNHSSLERAIASSWELLGDEEKRGLRYVSIFDGGFTLDAAEAVLRGGGGEVVALLESLREKALLQLSCSEPPRFTLYESIRAYAARELDGSGEGSAVGLQHAAFFAENAERWVREASVCPRALARLADERRNLRAAKRRLEQGELAPGGWLSFAVRLAEAFDNRPFPERALLDAAVAEAAESEDRIAFEIRRMRFIALLRHGELDEARPDLQQLEALAAQSGERAQRFRVLIDTARFYLSRGEPLEAKAALDAARAKVGKSDAEGKGELNLARGLLEEVGGSSESVSSYEEARASFRLSGGLLSEGLALSSLSGALLAQGDTDRLLPILDELDRITERAQQGGGALPCQGGGAKVEAAAAAWSALGLLRLGGMARLYRGMLELLDDRPSEAVEKLKEASSILYGAGDHRLAARLEPFAAVAMARCRKPEDARAMLASARSRSEAHRDPVALICSEVLEGVVELELLIQAADAKKVEKAMEDGERALALLAGSRQDSAAYRGFASAIARRLAEETAARYEQMLGARISWGRQAATGGAIGREDPSAAGTDALLIGPDAVWFEYGSHPRTHLGRRGAQRRLLQALVEYRILAPGHGLSLEQMAKSGWPGESVTPSAAANRVYNSVNALRKAGLADVLLRQADGYLLSPDVPVRRSRD